MRRTIARYTVDPGREGHNAELVRAVYRELAGLARPVVGDAELIGRFGD